MTILNPNNKPRPEEKIEKSLYLSKRDAFIKRNNDLNMYVHQFVKKREVKSNMCEVVKLSQSYNIFYGKTNLKKDSLEVRMNRLFLAKSVEQTLQNALQCLCINLPNTI